MLAAAFVLVTALGGCGQTTSDDPSRAAHSIKPVDTVQRGGEEQSAASRPLIRHGSAGRPAARGSSPSLPPVRTTRRGSNAPVSGRARAVRDVTRLVFAEHGFERPTIVVGTAAQDVEAVMRGADACTAARTTEARLTSLLLKAVPWLRSVQIRVDATGQALTRYLAEHCRPLTLPTGQGRVVLTQRASGMGNTGPFTVRSSRWSVEYLNGGRLLKLALFRGGAPIGADATASPRAPGRRIFDGPGTFSLRIIGTGEWTVRVRDGI
jgi:hypothetical protein